MLVRLSMILFFGFLAVSKPLSAANQKPYCQNVMKSKVLSRKTISRWLGTVNLEESAKEIYLSYQRFVAGFEDGLPGDLLEIFSKLEDISKTDTAIARLKQIYERIVPIHVDGNVESEEQRASRITSERDLMFGMRIASYRSHVEYETKLDKKNNFTSELNRFLSRLSSELRFTKGQTEIWSMDSESLEKNMDIFFELYSKEFRIWPVPMGIVSINDFFSYLKEQEAVKQDQVVARKFILLLEPEIRAQAEERETELEILDRKELGLFLSSEEHSLSYLTSTQALQVLHLIKDRLGFRTQRGLQTFMKNGDSLEVKRKLMTNRFDDVLDGLNDILGFEVYEMEFNFSDLLDSIVFHKSNVPEISKQMDFILNLDREISPIIDYQAYQN